MNAGVEELAGRCAAGSCPVASEHDRDQRRTRRRSEPTGTATFSQRGCVEAPLDPDRHARCAAGHQQPDLLDGRPSPRRPRPTIRPSYMTAIRSASVEQLVEILADEQDRDAARRPRRAGTRARSRSRRRRARASGAAITSTRGSPENSRASTTFCRFPPESWRAGRAGPGALHVVAADQLDGPVADAAEPEERPGRVRRGRGRT